MNVPKIAVALVLPLLAIATAATAQRVSTHPDSVRIITTDVKNFWRGYDRLRPQSTREDSVAVFAEEYLANATPGLTAFTRTRLQKPENLLRGLGMLPRYYASVRGNTLRIRDHEQVIRSGLRRLHTLYPDGTFPDIYFLMSGFIAQGNLSDGMLLIGAEMVSADSTVPLDEMPPFLRDVDLSADVLPCIVVHEFVHHMQDYPRDRSLLAQSLVEGVADFVTREAVGCVPTATATYTWGDAHERELWEEFDSAKASTDHSRWLYNGNGSTDRASNLGYWMGFQIARSFYERASDKRQAIHDLLHIRDFPAFLAASGYAERFR